ncbi:S-layer homology domain-containing protein [Paenibacillus puerhi]|uniref:S-layer homology domain-containing protein n=1 Tax=Paenibacillus puerhi TaxID=2692622 RepID=UPI001358C66F|nr:S-layer homology domain-containing protein [Paenibacillus puerhi]
MKKKILATTVAASLAVASFAGLPLSQKGLFEKLGFSNAAHAATLDDVAAKLQKLQSYLDWEPGEKAAVEAADAKLKGLSDVSLVSLLTTELNEKEDKEAVLKLFTQLDPFFGTNKDTLIAYLNKSEVRATLQKLQEAAGVDLKQSEVSTNDVLSYAYSFQSKLLEKLQDADFISLGKLAAQDKAELKKIVKEAAEAVLSESNKFNKLLAGLGIGAEEIAETSLKFIDEVDPEHQAVYSLGLAALRYKVDKSISNVESSSVNGTYKFNFNVAGIKVPAKLLEVGFTPADRGVTVSYDESLGRVTASVYGAGASVTGEVYGRLALGIENEKLNKLVFKKTITVSKEEEQKSGNGGGGGGGGSATTNDPAVDAVSKELDQAAAELAKLEGAAKQEFLDKLVDKAFEAIAKAATLDLSGKVSVTDGKAELKIDAADLVKQIQNVLDQAKLLSDKLDKLGVKANLTEKLVLKLNLGKVDAGSIAIPLAKSVLEAAKTGKIDQVAILVNGVGVALNPVAFNGDTNLSIQTRDASAAKDVTDLPLASKVYEFNITVDGKTVTVFSQPIVLSLPVEDASKFDKEKLTLVKIVDGALENYGGMYDPTTGQVSQNRSSFSSYTVVENHVTFDDTASVQAWAGRQIEVAAAKGIVEGRAEKQFVPNETVTRAEFAKMIVNTFGLQAPNASESFDDVNDSDWFQPYVAAAVKHGLVNGRSEGQFEPNGKITRAEMATIAARALTSVKDIAAVKDADAALKGFVDSEDIHASLKAGVALSASAGIIIGEEGDKFNPNANSTRAQAAVVIYRLLNK